MKKAANKKGERKHEILRKANECFTAEAGGRRAELLFDEFWRRGEIALLFGPSGVGKSLLAMQIADALARGGDIPGFRLDAGPAKTLYVDLSANDTLFGSRYARKDPKGRICRYEFSARLFRDRPKYDEDLIEWIRKAVTSCGIRYVVIDDLSAVMSTCSGTLETVRAMRGLRRLRDELGISILVLIGSKDPGGCETVSEADLGRQAPLCRMADSVFAIGRHSRNPEYRYLIQTRCWNAEANWTFDNALFGTIDMSIHVMPGLHFEDRIDEQTRDLIKLVYAAHERGETFREIAETLDISKSRALRLYRKWTPVMERSEPPVETDESPKTDLMQDDDDNEEPCEREEEFELDIAKDEPKGPPMPDETPPIYGPERMTVFDLQRGIDGYGREIFIERQDANFRPTVWYQIDSSGRLFRSERKLFGIRRELCAASAFL